MDKMNSSREATAMRGISNVYSGLGMLLGTGRISAATYDHILLLLNDEEAPGLEGKESEKPPVGHPRPRQDGPSPRAKPEQNTAIARLEDPKAGGRASGAGSVDSASDGIVSPWRSAIPETPLSSVDGSAASAASAPPGPSRIVCPWYSTAGYNCREQRQGKCDWLHESQPGAVAEPLICSFWAENVCTKTAEECRFAHYWAQHRQIAPTPSAKFKRQKNAKPGLS